MEAKIQEAINKLPVIQKAHIYEPKIEDVAESSFKAGIREVVEWLGLHQSETTRQFVGFTICTENWQAKLKEWGIVENNPKE